MSEGWREFLPLLQAQARGPRSLGPLDAQTSEAAMEMMLRGIATPAQTAGFLLVGRAKKETPEELAAYVRAARRQMIPLTPPQDPPPVTVAGGFDGKLRTLNVGAAATLTAAAAGGRFLMVGGHNVPPKCGRTALDALDALGVEPPGSLQQVESLLKEEGFAAATTRHYLPRLHDLCGLRHEMSRRTALNIVEKLLSPLRRTPLMVGITHRSFLEDIPAVLCELGARRALVYQAIEGSDEAPLDGHSSLVLICDGKVEKEFTLAPQSLGLEKTAKSDIPWEGPLAEKDNLLATLQGSDGPVRRLVIYNAALRLWMYDPSRDITRHAENACRALDSGAALGLLGRLQKRVAQPV